MAGKKTTFNVKWFDNNNWSTWPEKSGNFICLECAILNQVVNKLLICIIIALSKHQQSSLRWYNARSLISKALLRDLLSCSEYYCVLQLILICCSFLQFSEQSNISAVGQKGRSVHWPYGGTAN